MVRERPGHNPKPPHTRVGKIGRMAWRPSSAEADAEEERDEEDAGREGERERASQEREREGRGNERASEMEHRAQEAAVCALTVVARAMRAAAIEAAAAPAVAAGKATLAAKLWP
jgi:hypothetical protein